MTEPFDGLLRLQGHDTAIDRLRHRSETLPERAARREIGARVAEVQSALAVVTTGIDGLATRQRALEEQIAATATRRHQLESRMRTGTGFSIRDLQAMDHEVTQLATHQSHLEEQELALLEEEEPLDIEAEAQRAESARLAGEAARLDAAISEAQAEIARELEAEQTAREQLAASLPADLLHRYETVRARRGGVGAAALVGDRCDGCHLTLPAVDLDRIRHLPPEDVVVCPECDRILVR